MLTCYRILVAIETAADSIAKHGAGVTGHSFAELGTICVTTVQAGKLQHHYPLTPGGINEIHRVIRERALDDITIAYPGTILYDAQTHTRVADHVGPAFRAAAHQPNDR